MNQSRRDSLPVDASTVELRYQIKQGMTNEAIGGLNTEAEKAILERVRNGKLTLEEARGIIREKTKEAREGRQGVPF